MMNEKIFMDEVVINHFKYNCSAGKAVEITRKRLNLDDLEFENIKEELKKLMR